MKRFRLKALDTGTGQCSHLMYPNREFTSTNLVKILAQLVYQIGKIKMKEKNTLFTLVCVLSIRCIINGFSWSLLLFECETTSFSKLI